MKTRAMLGMLIATLIVAGTASGYVVGRVLTVNPGDRADFFKAKLGAPLGWSCFNRGAFVQCQSGDAFQYVDLAGTPCRNSAKPVSCGVTVRVHTLRDPQGGHMTRRSGAGGNPVYVFTAF
jgi:hypothetical protein